MAGSLSPSCFSKKNVVQGWPVTLFCLAVDGTLPSTPGENVQSKMQKQVDVAELKPLAIS